VISSTRRQSGNFSNTLLGNSGSKTEQQSRDNESEVHLHFGALRVKGKADVAIKPLLV
jgi:hypothetical protein